MGNTDPIQIIRAKGDLLEKEMFANEAFAAWFGGYAAVWARYVAPRVKDNRVPPDWQEFTQLHYTCIVRCWNAWKASDRIQTLATGPLSTIEELELHGAVAHFFAMARTALELLHKCFVDKGGIDKDKGEWLHISELCGDDRPHLGWLRVPRNDLSHNRLMPFYTRNANAMYSRTLLMPQSGLKNNTREWDTSTPWNYEAIGLEDVNALVSEVWSTFCKEMGEVWIDLDKRMRDHGHAPTDDAGRNIQVAINTLTNLDDGRKSGLDAAPPPPGPVGGAVGTP